MNKHTPSSEDLMSTRHEQTLQQLYTQTEVPQSLSWKDIQARRSVSTQPISMNDRRIVSTRKWQHQSSHGFKRVAVIIAAILLLAIVSGTTYAAGLFDPILTELLQEKHSLTKDGESLLDKGLYTKLHQTSQDDGVTATLEAGYADANTVVMAISLDHSKLPSAGNWSLTPSEGKVTTSDGITLSPTGDASIDNSETGNPNILRKVIGFNADQIKGNPASLQVHAEFSYYCLGSNENKCASNSRTVANPYHFTYNFTIPFHAGHVVNVNKTITSNGKAVTLERVVITPSQTRFYIHGLTYFEISPRNGTYGKDETHLITPNQTYHNLYLKPLGDPTNPQDPHRLDTITFVPGMQVNKSQTWTLHILDPRTGPGWTFTFTI